MPAGQLMGLDDHPLPPAQGLAHITDRPLFQGSTLGGHHTRVVNTSPPHHDGGSEVRIPESLSFWVFWSIHNIFPGSSFVIVHHHLSSRVSVCINTQRSCSKSLQPMHALVHTANDRMAAKPRVPVLYKVMLLCCMLCFCCCRRDAAALKQS